MGLRLFDFLSNRTARSTRMARIALKRLTAGILAPEEAIIPMPTMQVSKIRQASMKNRKNACVTKLTASSTAKSAWEIDNKLSLHHGLALWQSKRRGMQRIPYLWRQRRRPQTRRLEDCLLQTSTRNGQGRWKAGCKRFQKMRRHLDVVWYFVQGNFLMEMVDFWKRSTTNDGSEELLEAVGIVELLVPILQTE